MRNTRNHLVSPGFQSQWLTAFILGCAVQAGPPASLAGNFSVAIPEGSHSLTSQATFFESFERATGVKIQVDYVDSVLDTLRTQIEADKLTYDVVSLTGMEATLACEENLLMKVEPRSSSSGLPDLPVVTNFAKQAPSGCFIASTAYAMPYVFDPADFSQGVPETVADFFDLDRFPGKRGFERAPEVVLQWALLADGVAATDIHEHLSTEEGLDRAFEKLDGIKQHIVWWEDGEQASELIQKGEVLMTSTWRSQIPELVERMPYLGQSWIDYVSGSDFLAVPQGIPDESIVKEFLNLSTSMRTMPYQCTEGTCPCPGTNTCSRQCCLDSLDVNSEFWSKHGEMVWEKFRAWMDDSQSRIDDRIEENSERTCRNGHHD